MYRIVEGLEGVLRELCMVRSKTSEVIVHLMQTAFGTPMFSQRPDTGYLPDAMSSPYSAFKSQRYV